MSDLNRVSLVGRVVADVEVKFLQSGTAVAELRLANNRFYKEEEHASFFDVTLWGKTAEVAAEYAKKGKQVAIDGRLEQQTWEKDGEKRSKVVVVAESLQLLGSKNDGQSKSESTTKASKSKDAPVEGEKIPF